MVYYYVAADGHLVYMGKDKFENEELIKWGWPEDIWFHVDNLSSAHVYVRLNKGEDWRQMSKELIEEMCQLVKDNSIEGCKKAAVDIVYTPCVNLKKTATMDVGQVGFKSSKEVVKLRNIEKNKDILKRLVKTQEEKFPNLEEMKQQRDLQEIKEKKEYMKQLHKEKEAQEAIHREEKMKWTNAMQEFHDTEKMKSNMDVDEDEDFM